jgi:hypothetical protein
MIQNIFRYNKIDYGFSCGRHWISINGKVIAQTPGDYLWLKDEDISKVIDLLKSLERM